MARRMNLREDPLGVLAFAEDVIDLLENGNVPVRESLLIGDEKVAFCGAKPTREDPFQENVGVETFLLWEPAMKGGGATAVAENNSVAALLRHATDEFDISIQAYAIGASNDVEGLGHEGEGGEGQVELPLRALLKLYGEVVRVETPPASCVLLDLSGSASVAASGESMHLALVLTLHVLR